MGGGHHLLPPDPEKKKKDTSARATLGRPVGRRGRPHGRHPAVGQGLSGSSTSSQQNALSFWLKSINIRRVYLFVFKSAFSLFSGVGEESSVTLQKPREGCLWVTGCVW